MSPVLEEYVDCEGKKHFKLQPHKMTPPEILEIFERKDIDEFTRDEVPVLPEAGSILVYRLSKMVDRVSVSLKPRSLTTELITDGYKWTHCKGTKLLRNGVIRCYWNYDGDSKTGQPATFQKWKYTLGKDSDLVIVHYCGVTPDKSNCLKSTKRSPTKSRRPRTKPSTMETMRQLLDQGMATSQVFDALQTDPEHGGLTGVSDRNQVKRMKYALAKKKRITYCNFYNAYTLSEVLTIDERKFVNYIQLPMLKVVCTVDCMLDELYTMTGLTGTKALLFYDTKFLMGNFYVSMLSFRHELKVTREGGHPLIPIGYFLHQSKDQTGHEEFVRHVLSRKQNMNKREFLIVSTSEFKFTGRVPNVISVHCWSQASRNLTLKLASLKAKDAYAIIEDFETLVLCETEEEMNEMWEDLKIKAHFQNDQVVEYFESRLLPDFRQFSSVWFLRESGMTNPEVGMTSFAQDNLNLLIQSFKEQPDVLEVDEMILTLYYLSKAFWNEERRSRHGIGQWWALIDKEDIIDRGCMPELDFCPQLTEIVEHIKSGAWNNEFNLPAPNMARQTSYAQAQEYASEPMANMRLYSAQPTPSPSSRRNERFAQSTTSRAYQGQTVQMRHDLPEESKKAVHRLPVKRRPVTTEPVNNPWYQKRRDENQANSYAEGETMASAGKRVCSEVGGSGFAEVTSGDDEYSMRSPPRLYHQGVQEGRQTRTRYYEPIASVRRVDWRRKQKGATMEDSDTTLSPVKCERVAAGGAPQIVMSRDDDRDGAEFSDRGGEYEYDSDGPVNVDN